MHGQLLLGQCGATISEGSWRAVHCCSQTRSVSNPHQSSETTSQQHWRQQLGWNEARGEAAVYHKSRDKSIGEKFALSNCFATTHNKNALA